MSKQFEEWDLLGELGEKFVAAAMKFQELKLALVHREVQRMADDTGKQVSWTLPKLKKFKAAWKAADDAEQESFTFDENEYLVTYARYLIEYLDNVFGKAA
jgi:hypothetical protein